MVDFSAILEKTAGTAEAPSPPPPGTYYGTISGVPSPRTAKTKEGEKGLISFKFALTEAGEDVDAQALEKAGGLRNKSGEAKTVKYDFWLTEDALFRIDNFLEGFGFERDPENGFGKTYTEMFEEIVGRDVTIALEERSYTDRSGKEQKTVDCARVFATPS